MERRSKLPKLDFQEKTYSKLFLDDRRKLEIEYNEKVLLMIDGIY
jgi:hypothetical protein